MPKKKTYQEILKENLAEFDTTKTVDVKGPMLDPILGYEGDGELPTYKDAASVLERYYFGEKRKEHEISEVDHAQDLDAEQKDYGDSKTKEMKHTEGPEGEEQAGTSAAGNTVGSAKEKEKDIAKEGVEVSEKEMNKPDLKSGNMKDTEGPEEEEQAGTGNTYVDFKKRVVESIEEIVDASEPVSEQEEEEKEEKEDEKEEKDEDKGEKEEMEEGKMIKGITPGPQTKEGKPTPGPDKGYHKDSSKIGQTKEVQAGAFDEAESAVPGGPSPKKRGEDWEDDEHNYSKTNESDEIELDVEEDITEALENEIIEKLISEMEDEETEGITEQDEEKEEKPAEEGAEGEEDEGLDVDKKMEEMVTRLTAGEDVTEADTMKHTEGPEGEEQAGTGSMEKAVPPRKDRSNEGSKEKGTKPMEDGELADA